MDLSKCNDSGEESEAQEDIRLLVWLDHPSFREWYVAQRVRGHRQWVVRWRRRRIAAAAATGARRSLGALGGFSSNELSSEVPAPAV